MKKTLRILAAFVMFNLFLISCTINVGGNDPAPVQTTNYTVTFDAAGGSPTPQVQTVASGAKATRPSPNPSKSSARFLGWFSGNSTTPFDFNTTITANITLTAHWQEANLSILSFGDPEDDRIITLCDEFMEENPDIVIDLTIKSDEEYHTEVASRISANNIPDIAYMGIDERWGSAWREANQFVDNTSYFPSFIDTDLVPSISISGTNIKPYLPLGGPNYCSVVGVNTSLLTTVDPTGRIPETYTDLLTLVQKVEQYNEAHDTDIKVLSTHGADEWVWGSCVLSGIIPRTTGDAGWIEKAVDGQVDFTDDDFITALNVIKRWIADGILDPASATTNDQTGKNNFAQGKYVMYIDGQWGFGEAVYHDMTSDIELITIPAVPGEASNSVTGSMASTPQPGFGITKKCSQNATSLDAAKRWLAYVNSQEETLNRLESGAISCPIISNFEYPDDMDPLVSEKANLAQYASCYVIDSYLSGDANDELNSGIKNIVADSVAVAQVAENIQAALEDRDPEDVTTEVSFWHIDTVASQQAAWQKIINNFEADHTDVKIEVTVYENDNFKEEIQDAIDDDNPPDIFRSWGGASVEEFASQGKLKDITTAITGTNSGNISQISNAGKALYKYDDHNYGLPYSLGIMGLWYNTEIFDDLGLTADDLDEWNEFIAVLDDIKENSDIAPISLGAAEDWTSQYWWSYLAQRLGGEQAYLDAVNGTNSGAFNNELFNTAMTMYANLVDGDYFQEDFLDDNQVTQLTLIADGQAAFTLMGCWAPGTGRDNAETEAGETSEWGFLPFPQVGDRPGQATEVIGGSDGYVIGRDAPDAAVDFLKSFYDQKNYKIICKELNGCPVIDGYDDYMEDAVADMAEIARTATTFQLYYDQNLPGPVAQAMLTALNTILSNSTYTPEEACDAIQAAMVQYRNSNN